MPKRIRLHPFLTVQELHERYRHAHDSVERSRWQFLWLLARGLTPTARRAAVGYVQETYAVSQRRARRVVGAHRRTMRYQQRVHEDEPVLRARLRSPGRAPQSLGVSTIARLAATRGRTNQP